VAALTPQKESTIPTHLVWTEDEFLKAFSISRQTLLAWIAQGLSVLRCADDTFRITSVALNAFVLGREVETPYFTVDEAARYIKRTRQAVYSLVKRHRLKPCNGGAGRLLFRQQDLDNFILGRGKQVSR
jgi:excisionase family DNA binding protein